MAFEHFADLPADSQHRIEAGRRLLKDHRHAPAAEGPHVGLRQGQQFLAGQTDTAVQHPPGARQETHDALCRRRLAATGFAQQGEGFTGGNREGNAIDGGQRLAGRSKAEAKVGDREQDVILWQFPYPQPYFPDSHSDPWRGKLHPIQHPVPPDNRLFLDHQKRQR